jgi:TetR/AcrR family transcriptional regulator, regulator of autoinduction and epiphytic fitness
MVKSVERKRPYSTGLRQEQAQITKNRILDAASRLFVKSGYSSVTVEDIALEAGVAHQTVYAVFRTKLAVAQTIIWSSFQTEGINELMAQAHESGDLEVHLRLGALMARRLNERFATIVRFMRESGDPALLAEYQKIEGLRFEQIRAQVSPVLKTAGRLRRGISPADALGSIWAMTGTDLYNQLVSGRRWTASRYEEWLKDALINMLLEPSTTQGDK